MVYCNSVTPNKCLYFLRVFHSERELMIFTAPLMIAQSKCGMWMRTPMWKLCEWLIKMRFILPLRNTCVGLEYLTWTLTVTCCSFGHQDAITGLDCLSRERCVTTGGRDRSVRVWKIAEESQLVFHGHEWVSVSHLQCLCVLLFALYGCDGDLFCLLSGVQLIASSS